MFAFSRIVPRQRIQTCIARPRVIRGLFFDPLAEVIHEPRVATRVAWRINCLLAILQQALSIRERAFFLGSARSREEKKGTFTNTQRLLQYREKAVDPP